MSYSDQEINVSKIKHIFTFNHLKVSLILFLHSQF